MSKETRPPLNEKEKRVLDKIQKVPGLVLFHGLGTGKTRTSIQLASELGNDATVITPAALQENYRKELRKWLGKEPENFKILSQQLIARTGLNDKPDSTLVVDEAHRAREANSKLLEALKKSKAGKRILLTASPVYNHPADLAPLINLAANNEILPENKQKFVEKFIEQKKVNPSLLARIMGVREGVVPTIKDSPELREAIKKYVDYQEGGKEGFPSFKEEVVKVPLHPDQQDIYKAIMGKAPFWVRWKVKHGLPPNRKELHALRAFLAGGRQVSNSTYDFVTDKSKAVSPKIEKAYNYLKRKLDENPRYKAVIYSNYINSGLLPYKEKLLSAKIPFGEFSGEMSKRLRDQMVRDYNANKLRALLISSAGAEGLDLKGTRLLQILEPHFNKEKEKQIIGRAIRYKSHDGLPPEEQNVLIQRYLAEPRGNFLERLTGNKTIRGTDEYIYDMANRKEQLNKQLIELLAKYGK